MEFYSKEHDSEKALKEHVFKIKKRKGKYSIYRKYITYCFPTEKITLNQLLEIKKLTIIIGNQTSSTQKTDKEFIVNKVISSMYSNYFPREVYYNLAYGEEAKIFEEQFNDKIIKPKIAQIDKTLDDFFWMKYDNIVGSVLEKLDKPNEYQEWQDNYMTKNKFIDKNLKEKYINWRKSYAGVILKA